MRLIGKQCRRCGRWRMGRRCAHCKRVRQLQRALDRGAAKAKNAPPEVREEFRRAFDE